MDEARYTRLTELAIARASRWNAGKNEWELRKSAQADLWISTSVILTDKQADEMIARLEQDIVDDAIYYANKEKVQA